MFQIQIQQQLTILDFIFQKFADDAFILIFESTLETASNFDIVVDEPFAEVVSDSWAEGTILCH